MIQCTSPRLAYPTPEPGERPGSQPRSPPSPSGDCRFVSCQDHHRPCYSSSRSAPRRELPTGQTVLGGTRRLRPGASPPPCICSLGRLNSLRPRLLPSLCSMLTSQARKPAKKSAIARRNHHHTALPCSTQQGSPALTGSCPQEPRPRPGHPVAAHPGQSSSAWSSSGAQPQEPASHLPLATIVL